MANIIINGGEAAKGKMTITRRLDITKDPPSLTIIGQFETHRYIEEITSLESERYCITGVTVLQESFGSDDFDIVYSFVAEKIKVLGGETNLSQDQINEEEKKLYGDDD